MGKYLPNGALGVALAGLLAAFMAGMAANVSSFNTVFTYDIWQTYIRKGRRDRYYLNVGRVVTVVGILIGIGTAFIASGYNNIQNYIQLLFSFFNAPLFATFILAMFWKRTTPWSGIAGLAAGTIGAAVMHFAGYHIAYFYPHQVLDPTHATINAQMVNFYGAIAAFVADLVVTVLVTLVTKPKPVSELGRPGLGRARPECARPGERAQAGLVEVTQAAGRGRPGHRPRLVHRLRVGRSTPCPRRQTPAPKPRSRPRPGCSTCGR